MLGVYCIKFSHFHWCEVSQMTPQGHSDILLCGIDHSFVRWWISDSQEFEWNSQLESLTQFTCTNKICLWTYICKIGLYGSLWLSAVSNATVRNKLKFLKIKLVGMLILIKLQII